MFHAAQRMGEAAHGLEDALPVGIFVHMFYPDMWTEIAGYLQNMQGVKHELYINLVTSSFDSAIFSQIRRDFPDAQILVSPNEGRDIGGLFRLFAEVDFNKLSAVAICHSKKSPHLAAGVGQSWMRDLMDAYADTRENYAKNVRIIQHDPSVGMIASAKWRRIGVGRANDHHYQRISLLLPQLKGRTPEYLSGTMFLAKPAIIQGVYSALKELEFENGDGLDLRFQIDGQVAHAIERAFGHMSRSLALNILWR
jgi:lipopolysaccharide biosynthesis protein